MQRTFNKHNKFIFEVIERIPANKIRQKEQELINFFKNDNFFMNLSLDAISPSRTPEGKKKLADSNKKRVWTKESREKISKSRAGKSTDLTNRRSYNGTNNPNSRISDEQIIQIIEQRKNGVLIKELASKFRVNNTTISRICGKHKVYHKPKVWTEAMRAAQIEATKRNPLRYSRDVSGDKNPRSLSRTPR